MQTFNYPLKKNTPILALGAESAGNFCIFDKNKIYLSGTFGDLTKKDNFLKFKRAVLFFLNKNKLSPQIIISDLHPLMETTLWGAILAKKYKAKHILVQHHHAHFFSALGDKIISDKSYHTPTIIYGITLDGTGYGEDEKIWGGEIFQLRIKDSKSKALKRIGCLENQIMLGGELAIREPARILIAVLSKFLNQQDVFSFVKNYYSKKEFSLLYKQLNNSFNCLETSSTGRILDAVAVLLKFSKNERLEKHGATTLLENNSTQPYLDLKPLILKNTKNNQSLNNPEFVLQTTPLFEYLIKNIKKDKRRLATTAQLYIAQGIFEIIRKKSYPKKINTFFISGGLAKNKFIYQFLISQGAYQNKIIQHGDANISFGQIFFYLNNQ